MVLSCLCVHAYWGGIDLVTRRSFLIAGSALTGFGVSAQATPSQATQPKLDYVVLVQDMNTGAILKDLGGDKPHAPASITKLMTTYIALEQVRAKKLTLRTPVPLSGRAAMMEWGLNLLPKDMLPLGDHILAMNIHSANDAAVATGEHIAKLVAGRPLPKGFNAEAAFVAMMNDKAKQFGMAGTKFVNASGLPTPAVGVIGGEGVSTARDLAILTARLVTDFPEYSRLWQQQSFTYKPNPTAEAAALLQAERTGKTEICAPNAQGRTVCPRHDRVMNDQSLNRLGIKTLLAKTGYTDAAGRNLAAVAERGGRRVLLVIMGSESNDTRAREAVTHLAAAFGLGEELKVVQGRVKPSVSQALARRPAPTRVVQLNSPQR